MKKVIMILLILSVILVLTAIPFMDMFSHHEINAVKIEIPENATSADISTILAKNDIIGNAFLFKLYLRASKQGSAFKAGSYVFDGSYNMPDITTTLTKGGIAGTTVTVPEGYTLEQIAAILAEKGIVTKEDFLKAAKEDDFNYSYLPEKGDTLRLQGFLYPETYQFFPNTPADEVIDTMLKEFDSKFNDEWMAQLTKRNLSMEELIIMASIVEREAVVETDRPIIAGIFYNRLATGMKLQSCATVQYALGETKPVLSTEDTAIDSPFNTYMINGLPPYPICSPGMASLKAALFPEETNYLFFVAKHDGSHVFSKTYDEHLQAKAAIEKGENPN